MSNNGVATAAQSDLPTDLHNPHTMGATLSSPPATQKPASSLHDLHEELLAAVVRFLLPRDVEALTVASTVVARDVLHHFPIWKELFCYRWNMWNFALERNDGSVTIEIEIDERLQALAPNCSESRLYQLLAHAVTPVPSFADIRQTERGQYFSHVDHTIEAVGNPMRHRTLDIAYAGRTLGGDRCVRANAAFLPTFRVAVYAIANERKRKSYRIGLAASAYFEISIRPHPQRRGRVGRLQHMWQHYANDVTTIGLATSSFPLINKQPGWDGQSIGFHGDDGHYFHRNSRGRHFSSPFGVGDTVGCGLRRDLQSGRSFVYFTNNGGVIGRGDMVFECSHSSWYPVVGLDSHDIIHFNFGQEPFACTAAVDSLFDECTGQYDLLTSQLSWYNISESDADTTGDELSNGSEVSESDGDSDQADFEMGYDRLSDLSELTMYMNRFHSDDEGENDEDQVAVHDEDQVAVNGEDQVAVNDEDQVAVNDEDQVAVNDDTDDSSAEKMDAD